MKLSLASTTELAAYAAEGVRSCFVLGRDVAAFLSQPLVEEALAGFQND